MVSYMRPVDENITSPLTPRNLSLNLTTKLSPVVNGGGGAAAAAKKFPTDPDEITVYCDENTKLLQTTTSIIKNSYNNNNLGDFEERAAAATTTIITTTTANNTSNEGDGGEQQLQNQLKKGTLLKDGAKSAPSKRVSFGSSKGSMVETLVFETPTPLPEHAEREFGFPPDNLHQPNTTNHNNNHVNTLIKSSIVNTAGVSVAPGSVASLAATYTTNPHLHHHPSADKTGSDAQEELERSKVRVSIYHGSQPQQVSPPENYNYFKDSFNFDTFSSDNSVVDDMTTATATTVNYDRQQSTESGWDNPFRPGGDLSREADEIVNMIKGGKPITPTGDVNHSITNGNAQTGNSHYENGNAVVDGATKLNVSQSQSAQNGTNSPQKQTSAAATNGTSTTEVSNKVVPGPTSASHVVIEEKKKKKCACCVIQ